MALVMPHSIFIHIPKTGGSWVRAAIRASGLACYEAGPAGAGRNQVLHCSVKGLPKHIRRNRKIFFCIRHPVSWLKSRWSYAISRGKLRVKKKRTITERCLSTDLNAFIENILRANPAMPSHAMLHPIGWKQVCGVWQDTLKKKDRKMGRTESIADDLIQFLHEAGETFNPGAIRTVKPVRVSGRKSKQQVLSELAHRVCDANKVLMEIGGY